MAEKFVRLPGLSGEIRPDCLEICPFIDECIERYEQKRLTMWERVRAGNDNVGYVYPMTATETIDANRAARTCEIGPKEIKKYVWFGKVALKCGSPEAFHSGTALKKQ